MAVLKVKFGAGELVLTKSTQYVGIKKTPTMGLMANTQLEPEVGNTLYPHLGGFEIVTLKKKKGKQVSDRLDFMRSMDAVEVGTHVYHAPGSDKPLVPTGSIYITFSKGVTEAQQLALIGEYNMVLKERRQDDKIVATVTPDSPNPIKCAMALQAKKEIKWAEPDIDAPLDHYAYAAPAARLWGQMWHLKNTGRIPDNPSVRMKAGADAKVEEAWRLLDGYGNPNIVVAVMDNGIDLAHPDLKDKVVKPWDFWKGSAQLSAGDPSYTHGTPCASVAIAPQNGGMCGAAPAARLMPLSGTSFSIEGTEALFNYVIRNGADVVSCSWGTVDPSFALGADKIAAIAKAARDGRGGKGCVICFAAGNEDMDTLNVYAKHPDVICVGATTSDDEHADYSNRGRELTITAPSNGAWPILAARAYWDEGIDGEVGASKWYYGDGVDRGNRYQHFGGTSSATPLVAGICALILSANPNLTAREVKQILMLTADKVGSPSEYVNGQSLRFGYGRINAAKAVQEALRRAGKAPVTPTPPPKPTTPTTPTTPAVGNAPVGTGLFRYTTNAKTANKGFSVQTGSFSQWANVKSIAPGLESKYKQPVLVHVTGSGSATVFRVLCGQFATLAEANKLLATMKAGGISGFAKDLSTLG